MTPELSPTALLLLGLVGLVAGAVDAVAGGGGLLTVPALLWSGLPTPMVLGTNKGQSVFGSGAALWRFARSPLLHRTRALWCFPPAFLGALVGVFGVQQLDPAVLRPLVMVLLTAAALLMLLRPPTPSAAAATKPPVAALLAVSALLGAYDGFFGPGTGTFLIMIWAYGFGDPLPAASANAKVGNFASNLAAALAFAGSGQVLWSAAAAMAMGQALGATMGARFTIQHGTIWVRRVVVAVSLALVARLAWLLLGSQR